MSRTSQGRRKEPKRFPLVLSDEDREALERLARLEARSLTDQVRFLIRRADEQTPEKDAA